MNLKSFQQQGYLITETEIAKLEKLILAQYQEAEKLIDAELQKLFAKMSDLKPDDRYNWLIQYDRNIKLKKEIQSIYAKYDKAAYNLTADSGRIAISNNYYRQLYTLEWMEPGISFVGIPDNLVEYAVTGQVDAWSALSKAAKARYLSSGIWPPSGTLLDIFLKNRSATVLKIQQQINAGVMIGDGYQKIARRVAGTIGEVVNGTASGQMANALRIVRTEGNRLLNSGSYAASLTAESQGLDMSHMWDVSLDLRTRQAHASADGQKQPLDKPFIVGGEELMYPGDSAGSVGNIVNCRCTTIDLVGDWQPTARAGRNPVTGEREVFDYQSYTQWADNNGLKQTKNGMYYVEK